MFRQHETGRKPRQKVRVRTYLNSNTTFLEIKKKDNHGKTAKSRVEVPSLKAVMEDHAGADFVMQKQVWCLVNWCLLWEIALTALR